MELIVRCIAGDEIELAARMRQQACKDESDNDDADIAQPEFLAADASLQR